MVNRKGYEGNGTIADSLKQARRADAVALFRRSPYRVSGRSARGDAVGLGVPWHSRGATRI
jgi:hypothetical protein